MNKKLLFAIAVIFISTGFACSQTATKLDLRTFKRLQDRSMMSDEPMSLLVKGNLKKVEALTKKFGGHYKYGYNNISSIEVPEKNLIKFSTDLAVEQIENPNSKGTFLMDTARIRNNIDSVQAGYPPLPHGITGKGVIVGIIDGGIYFNHPDFKHPDGTTRIRYIWDQTVSGSNAPLPYNYGNQWSWIDINSGNCSHVEPYAGTCADFGHGSCVAGIAAGNGSSVKGNPHLANMYTGVAPESELIVVSIGTDNCNTNFLTRVADAVDYIFKKADALGKPCVINTSVGNTYGSHDGLDLTTKLIEALLDQRNGRVLVAAAGNNGNTPFHLSYAIPADSAYTFFKYSNRASEVYFDWWADTADFSKAKFAIGCNDSSGNDLGRTGYLNVLTDFNPPPGMGITITRNLFINSSLIAVNIQVTLDQGRYHVEILIYPPDHKLLWRLQTSGSGKFDLWSNESVIGSSTIVDDIGGVPIQYPEYRHPDNLKTLVTSWQCSSKVITVGNYSNRAGYFDYDSNYVDLTTPANNSEVPGKRYFNSSLGPTRDNRLKPDVMATGSTTLCTGDLNDISLKINNIIHYKVALGGKHERNGGTSMASPIVAGIAALYLEKRPTATYDEIKKALILTATKDGYTGNTANPEYGNGKVNAFQALTNAGFIYGATDTGCLNYYSPANLDTGGCVAKVYGCTDNTALNYNPLANVNNGSCNYLSFIPENDYKISVSVVPNPFSGQTIFRLEGMSFEKAEIRIYDQLGQEADAIKVVTGKTEYLYQNQKLPKGIYSFVLVADGWNRKAGKLVIE